MNPKQKNNLIKTLSEIEKGQIPYEVFVEICRLVVMPVVEVVPFVIIKNDTKVILIKRPSSDSCFGGMYHIPGSALMPTDKKGSFSDSLKRTIKKDLGEALNIVQGPRLVGQYFDDSARGSELSFLHWILVKNCKVGKTFSINNLPANLVQHQYKFIKAAHKHFTKNK